MRTINIGLIGFGTVGAGVVKILAAATPLIEKRLGASLRLLKIADLDVKSDRGVAVDPGILTTQADEVLNHPGIDIVLELIGGIEPARSFILKAIANGKHVVTANKALLAKHGDEIFAAVESKNAGFGYEASTGGAIPIIRAIREAFVAAKFKSIVGIVNGTCNYILSQMSDHKCEFADALREAQKKGYAEADPSFDIEGIDSAHKIAILSRLAYGTPVNLADIYVQGISGITLEDIECARDFGYRIKLLGVSRLVDGMVDIRVHPALIPADKPMANVNGVLNAIRVCDEWMEENILVGHGAGALPTASAVLGDVVEIVRNLTAGDSGRVPPQSYQKKCVHAIPVKKITEIETEYFLRFKVADKPGVLSIISGILGEHSISIRSVIQRGRARDGEGVPLVMMTHTAKEKNIQEAMAKIDRQPVIGAKSMLIRGDV